MELTANQKETLTELINIGYGRAAAALSELTGRRIILEVPMVAVHPIDRVRKALGEVLKGEVASVHQVFSGPVSGNALLLLEQQDAKLLISLLLNGNNPEERMNADAQEALTEVGNILLNACLGAFGNLLQVQVTFSVPRMSVDSIQRVLHSITVRDEGLRYALMIHTQFHVRDSEISGYMVIVLGVTSLDRLLVELKQWE